MSNEEIVDIFGMDKLIEASKASSKRGASKRTFITNLFEGVETVIFRQPDYAIVGIRSKEDESIEFLKPVCTEKDPPDVWLKHLEA